MTKTQTILTTLLLACIINAKILVLDMEDLRKLTASENPNLLRSLLNPGNAVHERKMKWCVAADGKRWRGFLDEEKSVCPPGMCHVPSTFEQSNQEVPCVTIE